MQIEEKHDDAIDVGQTGISMDINRESSLLTNSMI